MAISLFAVSIQFLLFIAAGDAIMERIRKGILRGEHGIVRNSGIAFHSISDFAKHNLYHLFWGAEYECTDPYRVENNCLNACLFFFILEGELFFDYRGKSFSASKHDIVLLNLNRKHAYHAQNPVSFLWFLFNGPSAEEYSAFLYRQTGALFRNRPELTDHFRQIMAYLKANRLQDEDRISVLIQSILGELNDHSMGTHIVSAPVQAACTLLDASVPGEISIQLVAERVGLSYSHFSRLFHSEMEVSPSRYLHNARVKYAKSRLADSMCSIEVLADECGFSSTSNFIRAFKRITGMTPAQYRNTLHEHSSDGP